VLKNSKFSIKSLPETVTTTLTTLLDCNHSYTRYFILFWSI